MEFCRLCVRRQWHVTMCSLVIVLLSTQLDSTRSRSLGVGDSRNVDDLNKPTSSKYLSTAFENKSDYYNETGNPCRLVLVGDSFDGMTLVPLDGKSLIVVAHSLFDVSDGVVPAITYQVRVAVPYEHEFSLEYSIVGLREDRTHSKRRHQRERKHEELIELVAINNVDNTSSLNNEIVICSKNSIGGFVSTFPPSNTYTFDWFLLNIPTAFSSSSKVSFRLRLKSASDPTNTVLEQIHTVNVKPDCNLKLHINKPSQLTISSLWNSQTDNFGLNCTLMLIPKPSLGLEVLLSKLSIHGVREFCEERYISFALTYESNSDNNETQEDSYRDEKRSGESELSSFHSNAKFCGKLEDYSLEEKTLTFAPSLVRTESSSVLDNDELETSEEVEGYDKPNAQMFVLLKVKLPGLVKSKESFSLQINSLNPCQQVFLTEKSGTLRFIKIPGEQDVDTSSDEIECSVLIHVPYGNTIQTELALSPQADQLKIKRSQSNSSSFQSIELSPLDSINLESSSTPAATSSAECLSQQTHKSQLLIIHVVDLSTNSDNSFCFEPSPSSANVQETFWKSTGNQIRIIFNLVHFQQITVSYKSVRISGLGGDCDEGWVNLDSGCVFLVEKQASWTVAEENCQKQDAHLLTLRNEFASNEIEKLLVASPWFHPSRAYWIGANDRESEGNFQWTSGLPFIYTNWFTGSSENRKEILTSQPNDDGLSRQDCVELRETFSTSFTELHTQNQRVISPSNAINSNRIRSAYEQSNVISTDSKFRFHWNDRNCDVKNFYICEKEIENDKKIACNRTIYFGQRQISPVSITSPLYPSAYPDNIACYITVETMPDYKITVNFDEFVLEDSTGCNYDSLEIIERAENNSTGPTQPQQNEKRSRFCGDWSTKLKLLRYISASNFLTFKFESDFSHHFAGFRAKVSTEKDSKHQCSDQQMQTFESHCYLFVSSPTVNWKTAHQTCTSFKGHLTSVLSFEEWHFLTRTLVSDSEFDKRSIYWLGGSIDQSNQLVWTDRMPFNFSAFHQSDLQSLADWKCLILYWHRGAKETFAWKLSDCNQMSGYICKKAMQVDGRRPTLNRTYSGTGGRLSSINFPSNYHDNLDYTNHLIAPPGTRILLRFIHLNIEPQAECLYDYIEFIDRKTTNSTIVCGSHLENELKKFDFLSSSNQVDIKFHSDYADNLSGFELIWRAIDVTSCLSENQILTGIGNHPFSFQQSSFHTPNFPFFNLQGLNCVYTIVAPAGHVILLNFEVFEIGNGKLGTGSLEELCKKNDHVVLELGKKTQDTFPNNITAGDDRNEIILCGNLTSFPHATTFVSFQEKIRIRIISPEGGTGRGLLGKFKAVPIKFEENIPIPVEANSSFLLTSLNYPLEPPNIGNLTMSFTSPPNYILTIRIQGISSPNCHLTATSFIKIYDPYNGPNGTSWIICYMEDNPSLLKSSSDIIPNEKLNKEKDYSIEVDNSVILEPRNTVIHATASPLLITLRTTFNRLELTQVYSAGFVGAKWSAEIVSSIDDQFRAKVLAGGDRLLLVNSCTPNPCANNGQCSTEDNKHICRCQAPYTGPFCGLSLCDLNPCLFGDCFLDGKSFRCVCQMGYGGQRCDRGSKPCDDKPCTGHGECVELSNSTYKCLCYAFWQGPRCEERMQHIPYRPLSERMLKEPFWLGILTVFVVLAIIGLVFCMKRHFPEKLDKLLNEDLDKNRGISWVSGRSPSSVQLGSLGGCGLREPIPGTSQQSISPQATRSFLGRFGIRKPSLLSLSSATSAISVTTGHSPHTYDTRTFSLDDLLKPSRSMMIRTPSPHRRRNFSIHGRRDPVEKQQILQQMVSASVSNSLDGESEYKRPTRKPTIGEIIQMSEKRLRLASASSALQSELPSPSPTPSMATEETSFTTTPLMILSQQSKAEKKVTFARLLDKLTTKELTSSSSCSDVSCAEDKTIAIPLKIPTKKDRKGRFRRSKSYHRGRTSETESQEGVEMSSSDTTPDPIYTPRFPTKSCVSPTGLSVSATNSPTPKQSKSLSKIPSADSLLALFRRFSGSSSAPPSPQYSENEESSAGATPLSTPSSPRNSALSLNIRPPALHITTSEPTHIGTVEVPVIDPFSQNTSGWRSGQTSCITLEVPMRDYCLSPIHEVPTPLPTPSHSPANSPMMQRQQPDHPVPSIQIHGSSEAECEDENEDGRETAKHVSKSNTSFSSAPFSVKFDIPVISISTEAGDGDTQNSDDDGSSTNIFFRNWKRGSESEVIPDVLIHVPPDVPSESAFSDDLLFSPDTRKVKLPKTKPPPLVFANEILSYVKKDYDNDRDEPKIEMTLPIFNIETASPKIEIQSSFTVKQINEKPDQLPDLMFNNKQSSWESHPLTPPIITLNQNSEAESDSDTTIRRLLLRPNLTFLSPFAGTSDRVPSESNLSTSGYSSMASPCPSRCPSVSPLCLLESDEIHPSHCSSSCCYKCGHSHFRRSSLTPSCSRKSSLTTSRRCSLNGTSQFSSQLSTDMSFNENSENNLEDLDMDSAIEVETDHEYGASQYQHMSDTAHKAMSPISEEMKTIYNLLQVPRKNFPKSQSLDLNSSCKKQKMHLKGESLDSKLNSIDPSSSVSATAFQAFFPMHGNNINSKEGRLGEVSSDDKKKLTPMSSRSDSPLSDLGITGNAPVGPISPWTDSDGVYDCLSSEVPGKGSSRNLQNISPQQQLRRSGLRRNRRMSGSQNRSFLTVNQKENHVVYTNENSPLFSLVEPERTEKVTYISKDLLPRDQRGLSVANSGSSKRTSPKRRVRAQPNLDATSSSSVESLNSPRSNVSSPVNADSFVSTSEKSNLLGATMKSNSDKNWNSNFGDLKTSTTSKEKCSAPKSADKSSRARPKISRLKTISLQIRFLRRLEQSLTRKKETLAVFARESEKSEGSQGRRNSSESKKEQHETDLSISSTSTCGSSCSCSSSCEEDKTDGLNHKSDSDSSVEPDRPLLNTLKSLATKPNQKTAQRYFKSTSRRSK